jgi:hypothetical protein
VKTRDSELILDKPRVSLATRPCAGVSDLLNRQILNQRSRLDPSASADRWARGGGGGEREICPWAISKYFGD